MEDDGSLLLLCVIGGVILGIGTAYAIVRYMASSLISVHIKQEAADFIVEDSLDVTCKKEVFTGSRKEKISKGNDND